jgi:hypothetical protein
MDKMKRTTEELIMLITIAAFAVVMLILTINHVLAEPLGAPYPDPRYCGAPERWVDGTIKRSKTAIKRFREIYACPSTLLKTGECPGWAINHDKPLACGGCDSIENMSWMRNDAKKIVDGYERKINALDPPIPDTAQCRNILVN